MKLHKTGLLILMLIFMLSFTACALAEEFADIPVKGMVTMLDLGATKCIPCKMMAPIMAKLEKAYEEKGQHHFH